MSAAVPVDSEAATFVFADLAGYTAMTEAHGDESAADLVGEFCQEVRALLSGRGEEIKTIGDAVMLRMPVAAEAVELGLRLATDTGARHGFPTVRVGMNSGRAVQRGDDWFGSTVNIAARVCALATGGEVLLTKSTAQATQPSESIQLVDRGAHSLRNVPEPVVIYQALPAEPSPPTALVVDPVCRMSVDPSRCAGCLRYGNEEFHFCSIECAAAFARDPGRYTGSGERVGTP